MLNSPDSINQIFGLLYAYSYLILFPLMIFEGPVVTIVAGFLVSLGFMDFIPTYMTIVVGDLASDVLYYAVGRWWLNKTFRKLLKFLKINFNLVHKFEESIKKNKGPFLFFGKLSHIFGGLILFAAGSAGIPMRDFLIYNFLATLPKSLILLAVGFYFGSTITNLRRAMDITVLGLFVFTLVLIGLFFVVISFSNKYIKKLEK